MKGPRWVSVIHGLPILHLILSCPSFPPTLAVSSLLRPPPPSCPRLSTTLPPSVSFPVSFASSLFPTPALRLPSPPALSVPPLFFVSPPIAGRGGPSAPLGAWTAAEPLCAAPRGAARRCHGPHTDLPPRWWRRCSPSDGPYVSPPPRPPPPRRHPRLCGTPLIPVPMPTPTLPPLPLPPPGSSRPACHGGAPTATLPILQAGVREGGANEATALATLRDIERVLPNYHASIRDTSRRLSRGLFSVWRVCRILRQLRRHSAAAEAARRAPVAATTLNGTAAGGHVAVTRRRHTRWRRQR